MPDTGFRLYATEDGADAQEETTAFSDQEFRDATEREARLGDRSREEKLVGSLIDLYGAIKEIQKVAVVDAIPVTAV